MTYSTRPTSFDETGNSRSAVSNHAGSQTTLADLPQHLRYIVLEGVIGAGKTTLAKILADRFSGHLVLEEFDLNPFLDLFYQDAKRWALPVQLDFLASRYRQQVALAERKALLQFTVADYAFEKDRLFAEMNLEGLELQLYETIYDLLRPSIPRPDLVVYLRSTPDRLLRNIAERGRPYESDIDPQYVATLASLYDEYYADYRESPLLVIDVADIDFVKNPGDLDAVLREIMSSSGDFTKVSP